MSNLQNINELDKRISGKVLQDFENANNHYGLLNPLDELRSLIVSTPHLNWTHVKDKILLSKRLSQCLNVINTSDGIHERIINIYDVLFENLMNHNKFLGDDLGLYLSGVFSFFQSANLNRKIIIINQFLTNRYLKLQKEEIYLSLPGFIIGIIPGLEEIKDNLVRSIIELIGKIIKKIGSGDFFDILYMTMIKNPSIRNAGIKLISQIIPIFNLQTSMKLYEEGKNKKRENEVSSEEEDNDDTEKIFNLDEENNKNEIIIIDNYKKCYFNDLEVLFTNMIISNLNDSSLLVKKSTLDFLIKKLPFSSCILTNKVRQKLLVAIFLLFKKSDNNITRRFLQWTLGKLHEEDEIDEKESSIELLLLNIKNAMYNILENYFKTEEEIQSTLRILEIFFKQKEVFITTLFANISFELLKKTKKSYIYSKDDEITSKLRKFFLSDELYKVILWMNLKDNFNNLMEIKSDSEDIKFIIDLIKFTRNIIPCDSIEINYVILKNLVKAILNNIEIKNENFEKLLDVLNTSLNFCYDYKNIFKRKVSNIEKLEESVNETNIMEGNKLFNNYSHSIIEANTLSINEILIDFTNYYIKIINFIWKNQNSYLIEREIFKKSTEIIINLENLKKNQNILEKTSQPIWNKKLFMLIYSNEVTLSLDALQFIIEILQMKNSSNSFKQIQYFYLNEYVKLDLFNEATNSVETYCKGKSFSLLMNKLWELLDTNNEQVRIIQLMYKLFKINEDEFANTFKYAFSGLNQVESESSFSKSENINKLVISIKRFKQFWKLSMDFYPDILFFRNHFDCIFNMLICLNHINPVLRHYSKSWIVHTNTQLYKLLDPILYGLNFVTNGIDIKKTMGEFIFSESYNFKEVILGFERIKLILLNMKNNAIEYIFNNKVSNDLIESDISLKESNKYQEKEAEWKYFEYIVTLTLRFIKSEFKFHSAEHEDLILNKDLISDHFAVTSTACEFLEFLISFIENKTRVVLNSTIITDTILEILYKNIIKKDEVIQIQLLNLLTVIYQIQISSWKENIHIAQKVFNSEMLHQCIIKGLQTDYTYLRSHYIEFSEMLLPLFEEIIDNTSNNSIANQLLISNSDFLAKNISVNSVPSYKRKISIKSLLNSTINNEVNIGNSILSLKLLNENSDYENDDDTDEDNQNDCKLIYNSKTTDLNIKTTTDDAQCKYFQVNELNKEDYNIFIYLFKSNFKQLNEEYENKLDDLDTTQIIKGLKKIMFHYMGIRNPFFNYNQLNWGEIRNLLIKFDLIKDKDAKNNLFLNLKKTISESNIQIRPNNAISFNVFEDVIASLLFAWKNESLICLHKDYFLSRYGILLYSKLKAQEKDSDLTTSEYEILITKIEKNPLKSEIIHILRNIFITNPIEFFEKFISLWIKEEHRYLHIYKPKSKTALTENQILYTLLEILICMEIPDDIIFLIIKKGFKSSQVKSSKKINGSYRYLFSKEGCIFEQKILLFIYSYVTYISSLRNLKIEAINEILEILEFYEESRYPMTKIWIYEIINLISELIIPSYLAVTRNIPINDKDYLREMIQKRQNTFSNYIRLFNKMDSITFDFLFFDKECSFLMESESTPILTPLPPTIYQTIFNYIIHNQLKFSNLNEQSYSYANHSHDDHGVGLFTDYFSTDHLKSYLNDLISQLYNNNEFNNSELINTIRTMFYITLHSIYFNIIKNLYKEEKSSKVRINFLLDKIFNVLKKNKVNTIEFELANQFLANLMSEGSQIVLQTHKKQIMGYYFTKEFFSMSDKCLKQWKIIIQKFAASSPEIIDEFLLNLKNSGFFIFGSNEKFRTTSLQRLSFFLYSCEKDTFQSKLRVIISHIKELYVELKDLPHLENQAFLILRVLFIRFSHENLLEIIRQLWPIIYSELIARLNSSKNLDVLYSVIKFIEFMSVASKEYFSLFQWSFLQDTNDISRLKLIKENFEHSICFKPFIMRPLKMKEIDNETILNIISKKNEEKKRKDMIPLKSLVLKEPKIKSWDELYSSIINIIITSNIYNTDDTQVDWIDIERIIEKDFLA